MKTKILKIIVFLVVVGGVGVLGYNIGVKVGEENILLRTPPQYLTNPSLIDGEEAEQVDFGIFWEAWRKLETHFLDRDALDHQQMIYGAVEGMVSSLDDTYTVFFTPKESDDFKEELSGKYEGVGMYVGIKNEQLTVISPIKGTPAYQAGLKAGDKILKIDETYTSDLTIDEAVKLIKGPRGTAVTLLIERPSFKEPKEFTITRDKIKIPTLEWEIKGEDIALIKLYQFNQMATTEFSKAAMEVLNSSAKKIILDLRNNPGGYLEEAQNLAGWFLEKDDVVVWQETKNEETQETEKKKYEARGPSVFLEYPVVVLVNKGSASASEILAGALRDQRGAKLVGETSFGKGSVQEQIDLSDGSSLKITVSKWLTPDYNLIDKQGLTPDIEVTMPEADDLEIGEDPQLDKAIELFNNL